MCLSDIVFFCINSFVCNIPKRTTDADAVVVPKVPADFANNHGNRIRRKFYHLVYRIKIINCFHKPDTADLEEVIRIFVAVLETLGSHLIPGADFL